MFANLSPGTQEQGLVSETRKLRGWIERMWHLCSPFLHYGSYFPRGRRQMGLVSKLVNIKLKSLHLQICGHGLYGWNKWHCVSVLSDAENRVRDRSVIFFLFVFSLINQHVASSFYLNSTLYDDNQLCVHRGRSCSKTPVTQTFARYFNGAPPTLNVVWFVIHFVKSWVYST